MKEKKNHIKIDQINMVIIQTKSSLLQFINNLYIFDFFIICHKIQIIL